MNNILRKLRVTEGYSQQQVAEKLDITQASYARIESGKTKLSTDRIDQLAKIFDVQPEILLSSSNKSVLVDSDLSVTNEYIKKIIALNLELRTEIENNYKTRIAHLENENKKLQDFILNKLK